MTLTLVYDGGRELDVTVTAPAGALLADLAPGLTAAVGRPGATLYAGSRALPPDAPVGDDGLRNGAVVGVGSPGPRDLRGGGVMELRVVGGPDAGRALGLTRGAHLLGRDSSCALQLRDPDVSRRQAQLLVGGDGVTVADLGSTNGSRLDGVPLTGTPAPMAPGQWLRVGESLLALAVPAEPPATLRPGEDGTLAVNRPPRLADPPYAVTIELPTEPAARPRPKLALLALGMPLVAGVGMAVAFATPQFLLFMLLSPLLMLGSYLSERVGRRRGRRGELAAYRAAMDQAEAARDAALVRDAALRRAASPDPAAVRTIAERPSRRLWERRRTDPDHLVLRLGTATLPGGVTLQRGTDTSYAPVPDVPVTVALPEVGVFGLAGPRAPLLAAARAVLCQLATLHSPRDVALVLLAEDPGADWSWLRWLPHVQGRVGLTPAQRGARVAELIRLLDDRVAGSPVVVVLDGAGALRADPDVRRLLAEGPGAGILAICLDQAEPRLPAECAAVTVITGEVGTRLTLTVHGRTPLTDVLADGVDATVAVAVARAQAALTDPGEDAAHRLPDRARLLDALDLPEPDGLDIAARWARGGGTRAVIGYGAQGVFTVDLALDGPHALVAGTTGAGKSELLQTLIASLAVANRPEAMAFVLIDYKGGAAFRDCAELPHTVGLVTDLDPTLTERALRSLSAELTRREATLAAVGAKDIGDYPAGAEPLPRLVLVVDEFATLAEELPDFVRGLVGIAQRGRSLGIHLVLATQRPGGVVTPEIRANTSLRIALRVTDDGESRDVIDEPGAARISKHTPGRALVRAGAEPAVLIQTARVGGHPAVEGDAAVTVTPSPWLGVGDARADPAAPDPDGDTDLRRLVAAIRDAAGHTGCWPVPSPWLPPLPAVLRLDDLAGTGGLVPIGLVDHPDEQRRSVFGLDLEHGGSLLAAGGARSGRTTLLRTLLGSLAGRYDADDVHVHVLDCAGGGLLAAADLPHCGTCVGREETARGERLLIRLLAECKRRLALLARVGAASLAEYRAEHADPADRPPWLVLVVDGWEGFGQAYEAVDNGRPVETLLRLLREGAAAGIRVVLTSDRGGLGVRLAALVRTKIVLPLADRGDYAMAGIPARVVPSTLPPGRGLLPEAALECQVALLGDDPSGRGQVSALAGIAAASAPPTVHQPLRIAELPTTVPAAALVAEGRRTVLGVGGDEAGCIGLDFATLGPGFLIAGPARSGRSTALLTLAGGLLDACTPIVVVTGRRSPLKALAGRPGVRGVFGPQDAAGVRMATNHSAVVVLVDDLEALTDAPVADVLCEMVCADEEGRTVVGAGRSEDLASAFRGLGVELRRTRVGLLLCPGPLDGELLGVRLPRGLTERLPGRGVLVEHGQITRLQVALPTIGP